MKKPDSYESEETDDTISDNKNGYRSGIKMLIACYIKIDAENDTNGDSDDC